MFIVPGKQLLSKSLAPITNTWTNDNDDDNNDDDDDDEMVMVSDKSVKTIARSLKFEEKFDITLHIL